MYLLRPNPGRIIAFLHADHDGRFVFWGRMPNPQSDDRAILKHGTPLFPRNILLDFRSDNELAEQFPRFFFRIFGID